MEIRKEDFEQQFSESIDTLLHELTQHSDVNPQEFYRMTYILENLSFFGSILYDLIQKSKKE